MQAHWVCAIIFVETSLADGSVCSPIQKLHLPTFYPVVLRPILAKEMLGGRAESSTEQEGNGPIDLRQQPTTDTKRDNKSRFSNNTDAMGMGEK